MISRAANSKKLLLSAFLFFLVLNAHLSITDGEKLRELRIAHRDLDEVISRLSLDFQTDQLQLKRLKKRKLILKDQITRLESELIPDLNA